MLPKKEILKGCHEYQIFSDEKGNLKFVVNLKEVVCIE